MAHGCQHRIPVLKGVPGHYLFHILRFINVRPVDTLGLAVAVDHLAASDDIFLLHLGLKPLVDLGLGLGALYNIQPVPAGALGVLGGNHLDLVPVLDHIVNIDQLSVDSGSHHLVAHGAVDGISKINGRRTAGQCLYIAGRSKAVNAVGKQIQIALYHVQELFGVVRLPLPLQNLAQPA